MNYPLEIPSSLSGYSLYLESQNTVIKNAFDSSTRVVGRITDRFNLVLTFAPMREKKAEYDLFISRLNGSLGYFKFRPTKHIRPGLTDRAVVAYLNTVRSRIAVDETAGLEVGDYVRIGTQMTQIVAFDDVRASIYVCPPVRSSDTQVTMYTSDVWGYFRLTENTSAFTENQFGGVSGQQSLTAKEVI